MATLQYLTTIQFDHGALGGLPSALKRLGITRPFVVTDPGLKAIGLLDKVLEAMGSAPAGVYAETPANPTEAAVLIATDAYKASGADGIVALGGGSGMDLAKAMGLMATHEGPLARYGAAQRGGKLIGKIPPLIAIPTTSGTGSEASVGSMIILETGEKELLVSPNLIPAIAICDPELTLGLPAGLTAATGMDAVTHCIESILSPTVNPPADAVALDGIERAVAKGMLARAVKNGSDKDARWHMMMASTEGAMAFIKGLGSVHALSHAAGRLKEPALHHGTLNAIFLPHVLRFNADVCGEAYGRIARAMGLAPGADLADAVQALNTSLGIPANLSVLGLSNAHADGIVAFALKDLAHFTNPKPATADDYHALYAAALG
jgi:4-hydroxybutyrate dehydrogenase